MVEESDKDSHIKDDDSVIHIRKSTKAEFLKYGKMGETQDKLLLQMCKHIDICDRWWWNRD